MWGEGEDRLTPRRRNKTLDLSRFPRSRRAAGVIVLTSAVITVVCAAGAPPATAAGAKGAKADEVRGTESFGARDRKAPRAPAVLKVMRVSATSVTLTWVAARDNVGVTGYRTHRNGVRAGTTTTRSFRFRGLRCGTTYTLGVNAYDAAGYRSKIATALAATRPCLDVTAPSTPQQFGQTSAGPAGLSLGWRSSSDNLAVVGLHPTCHLTIISSKDISHFTVNGVKTEGITTSSVTIDVENGDVITVKSGTTTTAPYTVTGCLPGDVVDHHPDGGDAHHDANHHGDGHHGQYHAVNGSHHS